MVLSHYPVILCGVSRLQLLWCAGDRYGMVGNDKDRGRSSRPGAEDWRWSSIGRVTLCCLHHAQGDEECEFLGLASKPRLMVS
jgi:hypothetical protein